MPIKLALLGADALVKTGQLAADNRNTLMRDLVTEGNRFGLNAVMYVKTKYLRGPKPDRIESKGLLKSRINTETRQQGNVIETSVGSDVIYAAIQEEGGTTHPNVTDRMRKFAWFMFFKTGDEKFKRMALTKKNQLTIKIPARPYIRPGIEDALPEYYDNISRVLQRLDFING